MNKQTRAWQRLSHDVHVHATGARIERRGYPIQSGWYLVDPAKGLPAERFEPTARGCDRAFMAFESRRIQPKS